MPGPASKFVSPFCFGLLASWVKADDQTEPPPGRTSRIIKLNHSTDSIPATRGSTETFASTSTGAEVCSGSGAAFWASRCWERGAGRGASTVGEPGGADSKNRYLRMSTSRRRIESWPTTKPCRKVGCRDNNDVAGIPLSGVFYGLATTVDGTEQVAGNKSESGPHGAAPKTYGQWALGHLTMPAV